MNQMLIQYTVRVMKMYKHSELKPAFVGDRPAKVLVLGEFPTVEDEQRGKVFSDWAHRDFIDLLAEAGINRFDCRFITLLPFRPYRNQMACFWSKESKAAKMYGLTKVKGEPYYIHPEFESHANHVWEEIEKTQPNLIITLGDAPLWFLTSNVSVAKWRGSILSTNISGHQYKVIPTYSPQQYLKVWEWRNYVARDLLRAAKQHFFRAVITPPYKFIIRPSYEQVHDRLMALLIQADTSPRPVPLSCDIETIANHISCFGLAWSHLDAMCIPFMDAGHRHFYELDEEVDLIWLIFKLLSHPNIEVIGQNWSYDSQHIARNWLFMPKNDFDTMYAHHACFPGLPKDLGFLGSLYMNFYVYWKDELTDYRYLPADLDQYWFYNAKDCAHTFEVAMELKQIVKNLALEHVMEYLHRLHPHVQTMMVRGVNIDKNEKNRLVLLLQHELAIRQEEIDAIVGYPLNLSSPKQMKQFFYDELGMKVVLNRKTYEPTTDDDALVTFGEREPILLPLVNLMRETRSIGVFLSTFVLMRLDNDGRMRCNFRIAGPETFRWSSSKNPFGSGGNLQNIPKGAEGEDETGRFQLPNLRKMFIPDPGYTIIDVDLAGADAQIVAWEADDEDLKAKFRSGEKIHALNAKDIYGADAGPDGKKQPYYKQAKMGCHLTNYGGKPPTLSKALAMTLHEAELFQRRWFQMHPGIKDWHERIDMQIMTTRTVTNKFGFRRFYLDRPDRLLPEALAWIPQCLTLDHEVLTPEGWKMLDEVKAMDQIAVWDRKGTISFEVPSKWHFGHTKELLSLDKLNILCTPNHKWPCISGTHTVNVVEAKDLLSKHKIVRSGLLQSDIDLSYSQIVTLCAHLTNGDRSCEHYRHAAETIRWNREDPMPDHLGPWILQYGHRTFKGIFEELQNWGAHRIKQRSIHLELPSAEDIDWLHTIGHLARVNAFYRDDVADPERYISWSVRPITANTTPVTAMQLHAPVEVACPTVSTGFFLVRRDAHISVTGNSTVALIISKALCNIAESGYPIELLLQVHDSLVMQVRQNDVKLCLPAIHKGLQITVPYDDPLVIGTSIDMSDQSWGHLIAYKWNDII